jgi:hypothetical protein
MARSIQSPGVEIREIDLTLSPILPAGTNIFMTGFAPKGPIDEVLQITSVQEFEQVYGTPTNPAERYFYYGARQVLNSSNGNLFVSRMPYGTEGGEGYGKDYGALVYPVVAVKETDTIVSRNNQFIPSIIFQFSEVYSELIAHPTLSLSANSLSANGINFYGKFSLSEKNTIVLGFTNFYTSYISNPSLSSMAVSANLFKTYFQDGKDTVITTDLTSPSCTYVLGAPKFFELTKDQYINIADGTAFTSTNGNWSASGAPVSQINSPSDFGKAGLVIINKLQSTINTRWEGHYIGISDNTNIQPNTDHDSIRTIYTNGITSPGGGLDVSTMSEIPNPKLAFPLSASKDSGSDRNNGSISEALEKIAYTFSDVATNKFDDTVSFGLFKLRTSPYSPDAVKLEYILEENRAGSFDYYRQINNQSGGPAVTFFLENIANRSNNITLFTNNNLNGKNSGPWLDGQGVPKKKVRVFSKNIEKSLLENFDGNYSRIGFHLNDIPTLQTYLNYADALFPMGAYSNISMAQKDIGLLPLKLDRTLRKIENDEVFDLDILVESGLGTIYATACANKTSYFDDTQSSAGLSEGLGALITNEVGSVSEEAYNVKDNYNTIFQLFDNFCSKIRKDCMFIADPLRQIFVTGANNLVMSDTSKAFSQYIYNPLRHLYSSANSSYSTVYGNWVKINDVFAGMNIWVPFSPFAAADYANVDQNFEPWYAPAGFTRGRVTNALALAITPKQKERDMMYKISINPVAFFPNDGFNIFGQKTTLRQPSAFDRINVRRLFLYLEKATKKTVKYFIFEPNTLFTRNRVIATLDPIFSRAKNTQGVYDYQIVCDKRNNPPAVIDQNELVVDIYIKPVRAAEFILVNFYATSTGANFSEIIGS